MSLQTVRRASWSVLHRRVSPALSSIDTNIQLLASLSLSLIMLLVLILLSFVVLKTMTITVSSLLYILASTYQFPEGALFKRTILTSRFEKDCG